MSLLILQSGGISWTLLTKFLILVCGVKPTPILVRPSLMKLISLTLKELRKHLHPETIFWQNDLAFLWKVIHISLHMKKRCLIVREIIGRCHALLVLTSLKATTSVRSHSYSLWQMVASESRLETIYLLQL